MRWLLILSCALLALPARSDGIAEVLVKSQQLRLSQRGEVSADDLAGASAARVRASFERLRELLPQAGDVSLQLVAGGVYAEALFDRRALAASVSVGDLPEGERLLMLAHELGHLGMGHWGALRGLYQRHIPGQVMPSTTDPVASRLGAEAHALSHRQEFEADAFGYEVVRRLGFGVDNAFGLLTRMGLQADSATHPGTRRRLAQLRALDARLSHELTSPADAPEAAAVVSAPLAGR